MSLSWSPLQAAGTCRMVSKHQAPKVRSEIGTRQGQAFMLHLRSMRSSSFLVRPPSSLLPAWPMPLQSVSPGFLRHRKAYKRCV